MSLIFEKIRAWIKIEIKDESLSCNLWKRDHFRVNFIHIIVEHVILKVCIVYNECYIVYVMESTI